MGDPVLKAKLDKAKADGAEFGKTTDQDGCMTKAYALAPTDDGWDISQEEFTKGCLLSSKPSPGFCDDVPFIFRREWFANQCKAVGQNDNSCLTAFIAKRNACMMGSKNQPPSNSHLVFRVKDAFQFAKPVVNVAPAFDVEFYDR